MLVTVGAVNVAAYLWPVLGILQLLTHRAILKAPRNYKKKCLIMFIQVLFSITNQIHNIKPISICLRSFWISIVVYIWKAFFPGEFTAKSFHNQVGEQLTQALRETEQDFRNYLIITSFNKPVVRFWFHIIYCILAKKITSKETTIQNEI